MTNKKEILMMAPYYVPLIWGSESWGISAYKNQSSVVLNGKFQGKNLRELWGSNRELFGNLDMAEFPHLIKLIDAHKDLSVQVHPDDAYAQKVEHEPYGKKECWYILDCDKGATIIIGHKCKDKEEMKKCVDNSQWDKILNEFEIHPGDFFQINPGTIHAIKGGTKIIETQQTSDLTYRLYDYGRLENGKPRELHIDKALDVINYEDQNQSPKNYKNATDSIIPMYSCDKYSIYMLSINGQNSFTFDVPFLNCTVIEGSGKFDEYEIKFGDNFIVPYGYKDFKISGKLKLICSHV